MGRSYFLAEGTEEDKTLGLAWLINAAEHNHQPVLDRVQVFQENEPELFELAQMLAPELCHS